MGCWDWIGDHLSNASEKVFGYEIKDHLKDINAYQTKILDMKNIGSEKVEEIFRNVAEVDTNYAAKLKDSREYMDKLDLIMNNLASVFFITEANIENFSLSREDFSADFLLEGSVDVFYKIFTSGKNGEKYNWDYIKDFMNKNPDDISDAEYDALCKVIDSFVSEDGTIDEESYNKFLQSMYIYTGMILTNTNNTYVTDADRYYKLSPVVSEIAKRYNDAHSEQLQSGKVDNENYQKYVFNNNLLSTLINFNQELILCGNETMGNGDGIHLKQYEPDKENPNRKKFDYTVIASKREKFLISKINDIITTMSDGNRLNYIVGKEELKYIDSTKGNKWFDAVVNAYTIIGGLIGGPGIALSGTLVCVYQAFAAFTSTDDTNDTVDNINQSAKVGEILESFSVYASVTIDDNKVYINNPVIKDEELELKLALYEACTGDSSISVDYVTNAVNSLQDNPDAISNLSSYSSWYMNQSNKYISKLTSTYKNEIMSNNSDFLKYKVNNFDELTIEQKKEVIPKIVKIIDDENKDDI